MKTIATLAIIAIAATGGQTPAYAGEPTPDLPLPESPVAPKDPKVIVSAAKLQQMAKILEYVAVRFSDQCQNNNPAWFCQAEKILSDLKAEPAPTCESAKKE
jgi:hypothetical protein